jgi:hypothetical protein
VFQFISIARRGIGSVVAKRIAAQEKGSNSALLSLVWRG